MTFSSYTRFIFCSAYQEKFKERERKNWIAQEWSWEIADDPKSASAEGKAGD